MIATFYSYKGGVGRSMSLAGTAEFLASAGFNVLCVDFDLEAPGLESYFCRSSKDDSDDLLSSEMMSIGSTPGLLDLVMEYTWLAKQVNGSPEAFPDLVDSEVAVIVEKLANKALANVGGHVSPTSRRSFSIIQEILLSSNNRGGSLGLVHAGKRGPGSKYRSHLSELSWEELYRNYGGFYFIEWLRTQLLKSADLVLIDSRTGETEVGGVCTHQLADAVIMMAANNRQNEAGVLRVLQSLLESNAQEERMGRELSIGVISTRVEKYFTRLIEDDDRSHFHSRVSDLFNKNSTSRWHIQSFGQNLQNDIDIPYLPKYAVGEENSAKWYHYGIQAGSTEMDAVGKAHRDIAAALVQETTRRLGDAGLASRDKVLSSNSRMLRSLRSPIAHALPPRASGDESLLSTDTASEKEDRVTRFLDRERAKILIYNAPEDEEWAKLLRQALECSDCLAKTPSRRIGQIDREDRKVIEAPEQVDMVSHFMRGFGPDSLATQMFKWIKPSDDRRIVVLVSDAFWQRTREIDPLLWMNGNSLDYVLGQGNVIPCEVGTNKLIRSKFSSESFWIKWNLPSDILTCCEQVLHRFKSETFALEFKGPGLAAAHQTLPIGISNTRAWTPEQIKTKLTDVRRQLDWDNTTGSAHKWWLAFEEENKNRLSLVLRLAEELLIRHATITEFFLAYVYSNTDNIQANLHYLDYTRLKKEEERKKREAAAKAIVQAPPGDTDPRPTDGEKN